MTGMEYGCRFYTWQMSGERYVGKLAHIFNTDETASWHRICTLATVGEVGTLFPRAVVASHSSAFSGP